MMDWKQEAQRQVAPAIGNVMKLEILSSGRQNRNL